MTKCENKVASYLLNIAADRFHEDGCTDMYMEAFDGLSIEDKAAMEEHFNAANSFGMDPEDYSWIPLEMIQVDQWMSFFADRIVE